MDRQIDRRTLINSRIRGSSTRLQRHRRTAVRVDG
jgi:hypothetical protein